MNEAQPREPSFTLVPLTLVRRIALDAGVHERTVRRLVIGLPTRPAGRDRILAAMERHGVDLSKLKPPRDLPPGESEPEDSPRVLELLAAAERAHAAAAALGVDTSMPPAAGETGKGA